MTAFRTSRLFEGIYLFHVHSTYTDGSMSVSELVHQAAAAGATRLILLEHIRKHPSYDPQTLSKDLRDCANEVGIETVLGFEAKITTDGHLDMPWEYAPLAAVIGIAEHGFCGSICDFEHALDNAIDECKRKFADGAVIWVHPGLSLMKRGVLDTSVDRYVAILLKCIANGVYVERNLRYDLIPDTLASRLPAGKVIVGADVHDVVDINRWAARMNAQS